MGVRRTAKILSGSFCPFFQYQPRKKHQYYHSKAKEEAVKRINEYLHKHQYEILATSGIRSPEPDVELNLPGKKKLRGRPDVLVLAAQNNNVKDGIIIVIAEAKSSSAAAFSVDTLVQASLYALLFLGSSSPGRIRLVGGQAPVIEISTELGVVRAQLDNRVQIFRKNPSIGEVFVFVAWPQGVINVTRQARLIVKGILEDGSYFHAQESKVPGPWCIVCAERSRCDA